MFISLHAIAGFIFVQTSAIQNPDKSHQTYVNHLKNQSAYILISPSLELWFHPVYELFGKKNL